MHNNSINKKLLLLINKFIKKVINDDKNYNLIKNINNSNNVNIKLVNIFLENNTINNISIQKIYINSNLQDSINNLLNTKKILDKYILKKILYFNFNINKDNLNELLIINNDNTNSTNNSNNLYNINIFNFNVINKNIILHKNNNINDSIFNDNSLFFIKDLNSIYLIFEKNIVNKIYNIKEINKKTKNIHNKIINNKTKKNKYN